MSSHSIATTGLTVALVALAACAAPPPVITIPDSPDSGNVAITTRPPSPRGVPRETFGEGTHQVLDEIQAGTYRTGGSTIEGFPVCSWRLIKDDHLVASGSATGPVSIVVLPIYDAVESRGCLEWRRQP